MDTSLLQLFTWSKKDQFNYIYKLDLYNTDISLLYRQFTWSKKDQNYINSTSIIWTPLYYEQFTWSKKDQNYIISTLVLLWSPLYCGQLTWLERDQNSYEFSLYGKETSLSAPPRFDSICFFMVSCFLPPCWCFILFYVFTLQNFFMSFQFGQTGLWPVSNDALLPYQAGSTVARL